MKQPCREVSLDLLEVYFVLHNAQVISVHMCLIARAFACIVLCYQVHELICFQNICDFHVRNFQYVLCSCGNSL